MGRFQFTKLILGADIGACSQSLMLYLKGPGLASLSVWVFVYCMWVGGLWCVPFLVVRPVFQSVLFSFFLSHPPPSPHFSFFPVVFALWLRKCSDSLSFTRSSTPSALPFLHKGQIPRPPTTLFFCSTIHRFHTLLISPSTSVLVQFLTRNSTYPSRPSLINTSNNNILRQNAFLHKLPLGHCGSC